MTKHIAILRGDGIGPEIVAETVRVLDKLIAQGLDASYEYAPLGGEAYDEYGHPYPEFTQNLCRKADAVLLGAVGSPQYDNLDRPLRPERGLLAIRKDLNLFANLRPAILYPELANASTLKPEIVAGLDILIVRELTGDIYFGEPRGIRVLENGEREGYNTMKYSESEIRRIAHVAFQSAQKRRSIDVVDSASDFLKEGNELSLQLFEGNVINVELPKNLFLEVTYTEDVVKGDTTSSVLKDATLETGLVVKVPAFIKQGDVISVDTATGEYRERRK